MQAELGCQLTGRRQIADLLERLDALFVSDGEARLLRKELPERVHVPARSAAVTGGDLEDPIVHGAEPELALHHRARFVRDRVPGREILFEEAAAGAIEGFQPRTVGHHERRSGVRGALLNQQAESLLEFFVERLLPERLQLSELEMAGIPSARAVQAVGLTRRAVLGEFSDQHVGVIVDFPVLVPCVDRRDRRVDLVAIDSVERLLDGGIHRLLRLLAVPLGEQADLFGHREREAPIARRRTLAVRQAGPLEVGGHHALVRLVPKRAQPDQRNPTTLEVRLPAVAHPGDVRELRIRVARVATQIVAVGDVVDRLPRAALHARAGAPCHYLYVVQGPGSVPRERLCLRGVKTHARRPLGRHVLCPSRTALLDVRVPARQRRGPLRGPCAQSASGT